MAAIWTATLPEGMDSGRDAEAAEGSQSRDRVPSVASATAPTFTRVRRPYVLLRWRYARLLGKSQ